jgi:ABC-2 type transport system ATP-binding protein
MYMAYTILQERVNVMADDVAVRAVGLAKSFDDRLVLDGVDLEVSGGSVFALLGPNGAGKTTTVRILTTLLKPDAGTVTVGGFDVLQSPTQVRRVISLTGQNTAIDELLTGEENLLMMGRLRHLVRAEAQERTSELLARFELTGDAGRRVKTYSGGMRRKLDLAMSLISRPSVLFLDEPTTGLDPRSRQAVWQVLADLVATGVTIFLTTQYLEEADRLADRIAVIDQGRLIATGTADELKSQVGTEQVELLLDDPAALDWTVRTLGDSVVRTNPAQRSVRVATDGTAAHLKHVLDRLEQAGIGVATLTLHRPTLDDVFLTLTGNTAERQAERVKEMSLS